MVKKNKEIDKNLYNFLINYYTSKKYKILKHTIEKNLIDYPESFILHNLLGVTNKILGNKIEAIVSFKKAIKINPNNADVYNNLGLTYTDLKKSDQAVLHFKKSINLDKNNPFYYNNLGTAFLESNNLDEAEKNLNKAIRLKTNFFLAYNNLGLIYKKIKKFDKSLEYFNKCIEMNKNFPDVYHNLGQAYQEIGKLDSAILNYEICIEKNPYSVDTINSLAHLFKIKGMYEKSIKLYENSININPNNSEVFNNLGNLKIIKKEFNKASELFKKSYELNNQNSPALASYFFCKMTLCDWSAHDEFSKINSKLGIIGAPIPPFYSLSMEDNPINQMKRAKNWSNSKFNNKKINSTYFNQIRNKKIKIGYFSSDFHDHAIMFLISGHLRSHDTNKFEIFIFSFGNSPKSNLFNNLKKEKNFCFTDISQMSDDDAIQFISAKKLDFAIDLNGFTAKSRTEIFSARIAPVQINYLGYPGTMGSSFIDYIVADKVLIDNENRKNYLEKVIFMPNTYQPNDNQRLISKNKTSKQDHNLPEKSFVICCFNNTYKINKTEFEIWVSILDKIKDSVLWLLDCEDQAKKNLKEFVKKNQINPERLVFAKKINHYQHLERLRHADIFVDTFNYNAHTTCSDALWAGIPVVTKKGKQFASRVASSLLNAVGMGEMICKTKDEYQDLILDLAINRKKIEKLKNKLSINIKSKPLFDTKQYTSDFESLLETILNNRLKKLEDKDIFFK